MDKNKKNARILQGVIIIVLVLLLFVQGIGLGSALIHLYKENQRYEDKLYSTSELKTCPICEATVRLKGGKLYYIECEEYDDNNKKRGCGLQTGYYDSKQDLIEIWNTIPRD